MVVGDFAIELDTVVIGAGPGGYVAAIRAAELGQKVAVIERQYVGGVCLNVGCIPSKALITAGHRYLEAKHSEVFGVNTGEVSLNFAKTQEWKQKNVVDKLTNGVRFLLKKHKIELIEGEAFFVDNHTLRVIHEDGAQTYSFNNAILATGSRPIEIPGFKFAGNVVDSTGALNFEEVPKHLVVIGGGVIGCELGMAYGRLGAKVTIIEGTDRILGPFDSDMGDLVVKELEKMNVKIITNARAKQADDNGKEVKVTYSVDNQEYTVVADKVLVAVGRKPNTDELGLDILGLEINQRGLIEIDNQCRTNIKNIYAIGDIVAGPALAHKASYEGKVAAEAISGHPTIIDYKALPAVAYTDPELATTGVSNSEAKENDELFSTKFSLTANGRALSLNETEGFVRLICRKDDKRLVGAQVAGPGASDLISELTVAIECGLNAEDLSLSIHPHPSLSEAIMDCAEAAIGLPIHM